MNKYHTIVIADDDEDDHFIISEAFKAYDCEVKIVSVFNGRELLDLLLNKGVFKDLPEFRPDCILLDINMPVVDGFQALREIKKSEKLRDFPVYIVSTTTNIAQVKLARDLGAKEFYCKPNSISAYKFIVEKICSDCNV